MFLESLDAPGVDEAPLRASRDRGAFWFTHFSEGMTRRAPGPGAFNSYWANCGVPDQRGWGVGEVCGHFLFPEGVSIVGLEYPS